MVLCDSFAQYSEQLLEPARYVQATTHFQSVFALSCDCVITVDSVILRIVSDEHRVA